MAYRQWNFDIDRYINPLVPPPPWHYLPYPVARFFGYRKDKPAPTGNLMPTFWAFIGVFCALVIIEVVSVRIPGFIANHAPMIVGSMGATAVLEFYAIDSPLAQPRNALFGQLIAAFVGAAVAKLFQLSDNFTEIQYLGGALACACTVAIMALTKTVHPPAGATALLAVVDDRLVRAGWFLLPVMILAVSIMLAVALIVNNIERRFPVYWWTPADLKKAKPATNDQEKAENGAAKGPDAAGTDVSGSQTSPEKERSEEVEHQEHELSEAIIRPGLVILPKDMHLTEEEKHFLEALSKRL